MYIPGYITVVYLYLTGKKSIHNDHLVYDLPSLKQLYRIVTNILLTDLIVIYAFWYLTIFTTFSFTNLVLFFIAQDIYFYVVHKIMHDYVYIIHSAHHETFGPLFAWNANILDHVLLNIMSVAVPFWLFPNTKLVLLLLITLEVYTSVNGHTYNSPHHTHHKNITKRLGSIYIVDRLLGSF